MNLHRSCVPGLSDAAGVPTGAALLMSVIALGPFFRATPICSSAPARVMMRSASWSAPRSWSANDHFWASGSWAMSASSRLTASAIFRKSPCLRVLSGLRALLGRRPF